MESSLVGCKLAPIRANFFEQSFLDKTGYQNPEILGLSKNHQWELLEKILLITVFGGSFSIGYGKIRICQKSTFPGVLVLP